MTQNRKSSITSMSESTDFEFNQINNNLLSNLKFDTLSSTLLSPDPSQVLKKSQPMQNIADSQHPEEFRLDSTNHIPHIPKPKIWNSSHKEKKTEDRNDFSWKRSSHHNFRTNEDGVSVGPNFSQQAETQVKQLNLDMKKQEKEILFLREENIKAKETIDEYKRCLEALMCQNGEKKLNEPGPEAIRTLEQTRDKIEDIWRKSIEITDDLLLDPEDEIISKSASSDDKGEEGQKCSRANAMFPFG